MYKIKVLNQKDLSSILKMEEVIEVVEDVYRAKANGETELFPMVFYEFEPGVSDMDIKSGYIKTKNLFGLKLVSWNKNNTDKNLPMLMGTTMIFDSQTGTPLALLNADYITGLRTGAAGAIGAKYLARKNSKTLLMVGTGHIAKFEIEATLVALPLIDQIVISHPYNDHKAAQYADFITDFIRNSFPNRDISVLSMAVKEGATMADVIITATPSRKPLIQYEWLKPGTHISCIGADMPGKQELDEKILEQAYIVVDDIMQSISVGETELAYKKQKISKEDLVEIGQIISNTIPGRKDDIAITVFDSTGIALQDLATSKLALDKANALNIGQEVDL
ncbi:MAG: ornithine cyclodeaminase family protein [Clostridia bacterium]|nr:ornithine cyclodeaminase family protein [Clostridia bacterium]